MSTGPFNLKDMAGIKSKAVPCPALCELYYNFGNSNKCVIRNKGSYLVISPGSDAIRGNFEYQGVGELNVKGMRLYSPSLNKYDNKRMPAEIFITATGGNNAVLTFCIPIKTVSSSISSQSVSWFNNWVDTAPNKGGTANFDINGFSLNQLIPQSGYIIKEGSMPFIGNPKAKNIFFTRSLKAHEVHIKKIQQIIKDANYMKNFAEIPADQNVSYNKLGTTSGPGRIKKGPAQTIKCTPIIDGQGGSIPGDDPVAVGDPTKAGVDGAKGWWGSLSNQTRTYMIATVCTLLPLIILFATRNKWWPLIERALANRKKKKAVAAAAASVQHGGRSRRRRRKSRKR